MQQLFQSDFLQALGRAIAASIWQMGLLFLVYHLVVFLLKIQQAAVKNVWSSFFSLTGFAWFIGTFVFFITQKNSTAIVIENGAANNNLLQHFAGNNNWQLLLNWAEYKLNLLLPYLSIAYLFVLLWFTVKLVFQFHAANQLRNKGVMLVEEELKTFTNYLAASLGISKNVWIYISNKIDIPATIGFLKPVILLPATAITQLTPAQLEAVLLHELAHIRRNDYFWNLLLSVAETLLFFNPFALLLIGIARKERENSCDDVVMCYQQNAAVYAEALLNVEKARYQNPQLAMGLGDNKHQLRHRVKRILNLPAEKNKISTRLPALLFFTIVFALMGWVLQNKKKEQHVNEKATAAIQQTGTKENIYISPTALIQKENKSLAVRDISKKLTLEIKKDQLEEKFIVLNDEGGQMKFDKMVFEELPEEWMSSLIQPQRERNWQRHVENNAQILYGEDSVILKQRQERLKEMQERYRAYAFKNTRHNNRSGTLPAEPMMFYFNGTPGFDTAVFNRYKNTELLSRFDWFNDAAPASVAKEKNMTDRMKQARKKMESLSHLYTFRNRVQLKRKTTTNDSSFVEEVIPPSFPQEWNSYIEPLKEEIIKQHPRFTIIINGENVMINHKTVCPDSTSSGNNPSSAPGKRIYKVLEVIKL
ncbi:MAG: M56 family metallopeptidase [Chitinophagaceae bacterium]|nr:M56 family metallopeptidase [Chitinophagaceae bacterium]